MSRIKKVHPTEQLFHLFCNMTNADLEGFKNPQGNVFFSEGILWSYGRHYPMARKLSHGVGINCRESVFINANKSSVTTEKHKWQVRNSTKAQQNVHFVPDIQDLNSQENFDYLLDQIAIAMSGVMSGLKYYSMSGVYSAIGNYNKVAQFVGKKEFRLDVDFEQDLNAIARESAARHTVLAAKRDEKQRALRELEAKKYESEIALWPTKQNTVSIPARYFPFTMVRIKNETTIETSQGAQVPLDQGLAFLKALKAGQLREGQRIGAFTLDRITDTTLEIGCHTLNIEQCYKAVLNEV